jgi:hypothetical protein
MPKTNSPSRFARCVAVTALAAMLAACSTEPKTSDTITADAANARSAKVDNNVTARVHVADKTGAPIAGAAVTWTVINHSGTTAAPATITDATGTASVVWTLDTLARIDSMTASTASATSVTITANGVAGGAFAFTKISGDFQSSQIVPTSSGFIGLSPLVVAVADRYGNGIAGTPIQWSSTCNFQFNGGTPTSNYTGGPTDASGISRLQLTVANPPGICALQASINGFPTVLVFHITGT